MAALFSRKNQVFRFLISVAAAAAAFFGGNFFLAGPRLGAHYDFLMRYSRNPPAVRDIALIETGTAWDDSGHYEEFSSRGEQILEPSTVSRVILTLTEFGSRSLIVHSPVLGLSSGGGQSEADLQGRFDEEFALLGQNIRNLFQGIRVGSIPPGESERYVEYLVDLSERGKDRLLAAFIKKDEAGGRLLDRAADVFGQVRLGGEIRLPGPEQEPEGALREPGRARWYTRARPDGDGIFRRAAPLRKDGNGESEHIAFAAFRGQFERVNFVSDVRAGVSAEADGADSSDRDNSAPTRLVLVREGEERIIPLDSGGNILFRKPRELPETRRIPLGIFLDYEKVDEDLARLLQNAETKGYFAYLDPESYPSILYRYTGALQEDMLSRTENPGEEKKLRWLDFRGRYMRSLDTLLNGPSEALLQRGYETLIAREGLSRAGIDRIIGMRDEMTAAFGGMRDLYNELTAARELLSNTLSGAFCIMGTVSRSAVVPDTPETAPGAFFGPGGHNPTDAEVSVILANSLLTGSAVTPAPFNRLWPWCLGISLIIILALAASGPVFTLITGLILTLIEGTVFAFGFVFTSYWIDPLLPAFTTAAGVLASFFTAAALRQNAARRLRDAYGAHIGPAYLKQLVRVGGPRPDESRQVKAAIIALRCSRLRLREMREAPEGSARDILAFREAAFRHFSRTGGVFLEAEGDTVLIAYGSPLERACLNSLRSEIPYEDEAQARSNHSPAAKAVGAVMDLLSPGRTLSQGKARKGKSGANAERPQDAWTFGIYSGECVFSWSGQGGYRAFGPPVIRARTLAGLTARYHAKILVSAGVIGKTEGLLSKKIDVLRDREGSVQEAFYQILTEPQR